MSKLSQLKRLKRLIAAETNPQKRAELHEQFNEIINQVRNDIYKQPSFKGFLALYNRTFKNRKN